jgi:DNA replication protein DnaC
LPPVNCNCLRPVPLHPHSHFNHRDITVFAVVAASPSCSKQSISVPVAIVSSDTYEAGKTLTGGEWIERHENLLVTGSTGTGKTWLGCALGHRACRDNRSVLYHRLPRLLENLGLARGDGRYARMLKSLARVQVLILDDWGITPLTAEQRRDLLEIVDDRHGRASTVVTSQLPVAHWHEHIGNPTIADAVLDRLVHTAHRIELRGESLRKLRAAKTTKLDETAGS